MGSKSGEYGGRYSKRIPLEIHSVHVLSRCSEYSYRASIMGRRTSDLWIDALSIIITELRPGKGFMLSRRPSMKSLKSSAVYDLLWTLRCKTPSSESAGKTEYLCWRLEVMNQLHNVLNDLLLTSDKVIPPTGTPTQWSPCIWPFCCDTVTSSLINKYKLLRFIVFGNIDLIKSPTFFISLDGRSRYLSNDMSMSEHLCAENKYLFSNKSSPLESADDCALRYLNPSGLQKLFL